MIDETALTIFAPAWGAKHLEYLRKYALTSVMQSGNLPACGYSKIYVEGSTLGDTGPLEAVLRDGFKPLPVDVRVVSFPDHETALLSHLKHVIRLCIARQTRMLLVMPDTIIANGGIFNMREYVRGKPVSIAAPHLRVEALSFTSDFRSLHDLWPFSSQALVFWAKAHPHQSLTNSYAHGCHGTYTGGISLTKITDRLTTILHFLPTIYLAWFVESDAAFFEGVKFFGSWDHDFGQHLYNEGRYRVFGSSELFFAVELTDREANKIAVVPGSQYEEDSIAGPSFLKCFVGALQG